MPSNDYPVLVERDRPRLSFHKHGEVPTEIGMVETTLGEAHEMGAVACSQCFVWQDSVQYNFEYMNFIDLRQ